MVGAVPPLDELVLDELLLEELLDEVPPRKVVMKPPGPVAEVTRMSTPVLPCG